MAINWSKNISPDSTFTSLPLGMRLRQLTIVIGENDHWCWLTVKMHVCTTLRLLHSQWSHFGSLLKVFLYNMQKIVSYFTVLILTLNFPQIQAALQDYATITMYWLPHHKQHCKTTSQLQCIACLWQFGKNVFRKHIFLNSKLLRSINYNYLIN